MRQLHADLGLGVATALDVADQLLRDGDAGVHAVGQLRLVVDRTSLELAIGQRLREVLESAPSPRRGRPPVTRTS
ncbi:MAG: hypothetical protein H0W68_05925 [Gemmatimonadaceae bacterium]|nr:hypothetical protein [Gemmatimonadaceae bacterium]